MNGQTTSFDAYHILPEIKKASGAEKKRRIPRIDFDAPRRKDREQDHIDHEKVEQFRRLSRHDQRMEYVLSSFFAVISIAAIVAYVAAF